MSLMKTVSDTVVQFLPDGKHNSLLDRDGFLGKPLVRVDAEAKVKGKARFTSEFDIPNLAHAALVFSTIAKGKVSEIDTERAKHSPGVLEVLTWKNMPKLEAPPLVDIGDLAKGMAASNLPVLQDASSNRVEPSVHRRHYLRVSGRLASCWSSSCCSASAIHSAEG